MSTYESDLSYLTDVRDGSNSDSGLNLFACGLNTGLHMKVCSNLDTPLSNSPIPDVSWADVSCLGKLGITFLSFI